MPVGGLEIDHKLELGWSLHWQVGRFLALEDTIDVATYSWPVVP